MTAVNLNKKVYLVGVVWIIKSICILTKISRIFFSLNSISANNFSMRDIWDIWRANKNFPTFFDLIWRYFWYHWSPRTVLKRWENFRNFLRPKLHVNQIENTSMTCRKKISAKQFFNTCRHIFEPQTSRSNSGSSHI